MTIDAEKIKKTFIEGCKLRFKEFYSFLSSKERVYIYGSGIYGKWLCKSLLDCGVVDNIEAFVNDYEHGFDISGIPVISFERLLSQKNDSYCVVIGMQNGNSVVRKLKEHNLFYCKASPQQVFIQNQLMCYVSHIFSSNRLFISDTYRKISEYHSLFLDKEDELCSFYEDDLSKSVIRNRIEFFKSGDITYLEKSVSNASQYFDQDYMELDYDEVFVDCGAYDGDSIIAFKEYVKDRFTEIIAFEPDFLNLKKLYRNIQPDERLKVYPYATGCENGKVYFPETGEIGSRIEANATVEVTRIRLDDFIKHPISLIKMDIEGAEFETLKGAEHLIRKYHPKLMICVYHNSDDILVIPQYIRSLCSSYKFKLRQHENTILETVLYAEV